MINVVSKMFLTINPEQLLLEAWPLITLIVALVVASIQFYRSIMSGIRTLFRDMFSVHEANMVNNMKLRFMEHENEELKNRQELQRRFNDHIEPIRRELEGLKGVVETNQHEIASLNRRFEKMGKSK